MARRKWRVVAGLIAAFALLNAVAYVHAWRMTHYVAAGEATRRPEELILIDKAWVLATGVTIPRPANRRTPADVGLVYDVVRLTASDGVGLEAWRMPRADARARVLLFHSYKSAKDTLLAEALAFHGLGCETLLVDMRGSGGSDGAVTSVGVYEARDVAAAYVAARGSRMEAGAALPLLLFGHSMGAAAVLRAIAHEGVVPDGVIVQAPFDGMLSTARNRFAAFGLPSWPFAELLVFYGGWQQGFDAFAHEPVRYAESVRCPALVMVGERDERATPEQVQAVADAMAGETRFVTFPGVAHDGLLASDRERWTREVRGFLERW